MKIFYLIAMILISSPIMAEDTGGSGTGGSSGDRELKLDIKAEMEESRTLIEVMKYKGAIRKLRGIVREDWRNADAWNLLGYSQRKIGKYKKAKKSYAKALKYNPDHKGALEYQGELFITLGDHERARGNHQKLKNLCPDGCEELDDLTQALLAVSTQ